MATFFRNSSHNTNQKTSKQLQVSSYLTTKHTAAENYSSFILNDSITLNSIKLHRNKPKKYKKINPPLEQKMQKCLDLLSFTKKFQISSVQEKNFKKIVSTNQNTKKTSLKKDSSLNSFSIRNKQESVTIGEKQQFRRYLSGQIQSIDSKNMNPIKSKHMSIFSMTKFSDKKILKLKSVTNNIQKRSSFLPSPKKISEKAQKFQKFEKYLDQEVVPSLSKQIKISLMENNQYLVTPKQMSKPKISHKRCAYHDKKQNIFSGKDYQLPHLKFEKSVETPLIKNIKNKQISNHEKQAKKASSGWETILQSIKRGEYFKVEIDLSVDPSLLLCQDDKANNLLHHCIFQNKHQLFQMVLKKSLLEKVDLITMKNKFRRSPYELGHLMNFFNKNDLSALVQSIHRHFKFKVPCDIFHITR